ncbi:MAG: dihydroorotase [Pseudomonadota bacterium]
MTSFTLPKWYDLHVHLRQGAGMKAYVQAHLDMGCVGVLAMPNTKPPVGKVLKSDPLDEYWSIEDYLGMIKEDGGDTFDDIIVPLYLTKDTTPKMVEEGAASGLLRAAKYYPPHGTTNADHGRPLQNYIDNDVFKAMADNGVVLCVHGEEHGLEGPDFFDKNKTAEEVFYTERLPKVRDAYPDLKIVGEHLTTKTAAEFVQQSGENTAGTITPQHLLYTVGHLLQGLKYHLYCLPLLKFEEDRAALRAAAIDPNNTKFFAGTDSAPHTTKCTPCGCAAGCFTGEIAPQLYAQAFEESGCDLSDETNQKIFAKFLCSIGPDFYGLKHSDETFTLTRKPQKVEMLKTEDGDVTPLPLGLEQHTIPWSLTL